MNAHPKEAAPSDRPGIKISVCIPTYGRPELLRQAIQSLEAQTRPPDELIVVWREGDVATEDVLQSTSKRTNLKVVALSVRAPGFLPPIRAAIDHATYDVLAFMDDDAAAFPDWVSRMEKHYSNADWAGVGGRIVTIYDGVVADYPVAKIVGRLNYWGRSFGNMYREVRGAEIRNVDFLAGGNMSYRTAILKQIGIDFNLGNDVAFSWELDLGLNVRKLGYNIAYDPDLKVFHYTGPREKAGMRCANRDGVYWSNFNYAYIMAKHLPLHRLLLFILWRVFVGSSDSPGALVVIANCILIRKIDWLKLAPIAIAGSVSGLMYYFRSRDGG